MGQSTELLRLYAGSIVVAMFLPSCSGTVLLKELEMAPALIPAALLAIALWVAPCLAVAASAEGEPARTAVAEHQIALRRRHTPVVARGVANRANRRRRHAAARQPARPHRAASGQ